MSNSTLPQTLQTTTCPACGLLCDDIVSTQPNPCAKSMAFYGRAPVATTPTIQGKSTSLEAAVSHAARMLENAQQSLFAGLGTDVQGMRAVMRLADKTGAVLDHMNGDSLMRNVQVIQNSGWQTTTLTEVRNRVDLLVIVGTDVVSLLPRFFERVVWNQASMFGQDTAKREVVYLGGRDLDTRAGISPDGRKPQVLPCDLGDLPAVLSVLRALLAGKKLSATEVGGIAVADLANLAERLKQAQYGVIAWAATALKFDHAELSIQTITESIKALNQTTRCSGLPLGGSDGDISTYQVSTWISGYPLRTSYARGYPEHDPYHFSTKRLLSEADALLWVSSFNPERTPPVSDIPTIVLGHAAMTFAQMPEVFIPIATPGIECDGVMFRMDSSVSLSVVKLRDSNLPSLSTVLSKIEALC